MSRRKQSSDPAGGSVAGSPWGIAQNGVPWTQDGPGRVASLVSTCSLTSSLMGCGFFHLSSPVGGLAYGML